jgi:fatty acyl-CoA reductase
MPSAIADFYAGRSVFVTGGTGFMGKVLLEKLLRSCPDILTIYMLVRPKKGDDPKSRVEKLLASKLFDMVREKQPDIAEKVKLIAGDLTEPDLGISPEDHTRLADNVSVVFHSAATVRFDETLRVAMRMNVVAVKKMLQLCYKLPKLEALVHVSTAYAYCDRNYIAEHVYDPPVLPDKLLESMEWMDDDLVDVMTPKLIHPRPNTYTFTKALAEHVILEAAENLPCCIVRPSIVGAIWREPIKGWVDNFNGPTGLLIAIGKGLLRIMLGDSFGIADIVPVDLAINTMIAAAWYTATERPAKMPVYNCTTGQLNKVTWGELGLFSANAFVKNPMDDVIRIPHATLTKNSYWHAINNWFSQTLPAGAIDVYRQITGKSPIFMKIQDRVEKSVSSLGFFTLHQWTFANDNVLALQDRLGPEDQEDFNFDATQIDWPSYLENYCLGTKLFALKEDLSNMPKAKRALQRIKTFHRVVSGVAILITCQFLVSGFLPVAMSILGDDNDKLENP